MHLLFSVALALPLSGAFTIVAPSARPWAAAGVGHLPPSARAWNSASRPWTRSTLSAVEDDAKDFLEAAGDTLTDVASAPERINIVSQIYKIAALTERGQLGTSGGLYSSHKEKMRSLVDRLYELSPADQGTPLAPEALNGEWELIYADVALFRASPFFQMVEAGFADREKSELFFKLHELQTRSWGASDIGRVTQTLNLTATPPANVYSDVDGSTVIDAEVTITPAAVSGEVRSSVDIIALPRTTIPLVGWFKLLPTFGGAVATVAAAELMGATLELTVERTELVEVPDLPLMPLLGPLVAGQKFPTGDVVLRVLGAVPKARATVKYVDGALRVMEDAGGQIFVYSKVSP